MFAAVASCWTLLLGIGLIMVGGGLQGSLLGLRASLEGFPTAVTGLIMSAYYVGFLVGSRWAPTVLERVGHIRVFAALASLASASALVHAVVVDPATWVAMRLVTGACYAGLYVVAESWLNASSTNENRGQLLSIYMVVMMGGMAGGQGFLNLSDPGGFQLFVLTSVLVSIALVPISLTAIPAPSFDAPDHVSLRQLYRLSPLGVLGSMGVGLAHGAFFGMGAVYGGESGLSVGGVSILMGAFMLGGMVFQWPIGRLSDRFDRRKVLTVVSFLAAGVALAAILAPNGSNWTLFVLAGVFGGLSIPMYSLCVAHTNDHLTRKQMVAASSSLVLVQGLGAILGPSSAAGAMSLFGSPGFFGALAAAHAAIAIFAVYRMTRRAAVPLDEQVPHVTLAARASPVAAAAVPEVMIKQMDAEQQA